MKRHLRTLWSRLEGISTLDHDSPEERRRKVTLVVIALLCSLTGIIVGTRSYVISRPNNEVFIPYTFAFIVGVAIWIYFSTKRFSILLYPFLCMILCIPVLFQWSVGGLSGPGAVNIILWSILAPFGALMFQNIRKAIGWFLAYLVLIIVSLCLDRYFMGFIVPSSHAELMMAHGSNIIFLSITIFITMLYFVNAFQKEHARAENLVVHLEQANHDLAAILNELQATQAELIQSEKMASLGNLVAGVAHEINNPIGAVKSASDVLKRCIDRMERVVETGETMEVVRENRLFQEAFKLLKTNHQITVTGSERIETIVRSLRNFARLDEAEFQKADLHEGLDSTLTLLEHEFRDRISVKKAYGEIPRIYCYPNELNQVFMNLLVNAIQAIEGEGRITIRTFVEGERIHIQIGDTGIGIPPEQMEGLFEPSFRRQGSRVKAGMGLFTCYNIVQKHHGEITVQSEMGEGTTVSIRIPTDLGRAMDGVNPNRSHAPRRREL